MYSGTAPTDSLDVIYPLRINANSRLLKRVFSPFMTLIVVIVMASGGLQCLAWLGLPQTFGIPASWKAVETGLIHRVDQPSSVAEFAVLQDMIKKQQDPSRRAASGDDSSNLSVSSSEETSSTGLSEMRQLEMFYREYDPMRMFSDLRQVSDGKSSAIWTNDDAIRRINEEVELAAFEMQVRDLKNEYMRGKTRLRWRLNHFLLS